MVPIPRISSYFKPSNVLALPDIITESSLPEEIRFSDESFKVVNLDSVTTLIQHQMLVRAARQAAAHTGARAAARVLIPTPLGPLGGF